MFRRLLASSLLLAVLGAAPLPARQLVVSPSGSLRSLGLAIRQARAGDTILVEPGTYHEPTIVVDRRVTIIGRGFPVFDGEGTHGVLLIRADSVVLRGLLVRNVGTSFMEDRAGIRLEGVHGCRVEDNRLVNTFFGIYAAKSQDCVLRGNRVQGRARTEAASGNAIHLWASNGFVIEGNVLTGHRDGLYFEFVHHALIRRNTSVANLRYGLHFMFSDSCRYEDNLFARNGAGVAVMYTHHVEMANNRFRRNRGGAAYGLLLKEITGSRVAGNRFEGNSVGLVLETSSRVEVTDNEFVENGWAVRITASSLDDVFRHNAFLGNSFDVATNSRVSQSSFNGNYWDHYAGYDLDRDGRGDVPYRPVRLFSLVVAEHEPALILMRSFLIDLLDAAERVLPVLTPETLVDAHPLMRWPG